MKKILASLMFMSFCSTAFAKILITEGKLFIRTNGQQVPLMMVNDLIEKNKVSTVQLFNNGDVHLISFSRDGGKEKIYSVDDKGYVYSIEPFASYSVKDVNKNGLVEFKQAPGKRFRVNSQGIFVR